MAFSDVYAATEPSRAELRALRGPIVVEFGAPWCGFCIAAQPLIAAAFAHHPEVRHIKIEDGPGRPLGRSFRVTHWPALVFLHDGQEVARLVRPADSQAIAQALERIDRPARQDPPLPNPVLATRRKDEYAAGRGAWKQVPRGPHRV
jgi:thioredoxin 1